MADCDVDDILCQSMVIAHLKGLKTALGDERYREEFPELQGLDEKITSREAELRNTFADCVSQPGPSPEEEATTLSVLPAGAKITTVEEEAENG